jgi:hypothetical protein
VRGHHYPYKGKKSGAFQEKSENSFSSTELLQRQPCRLLEGKAGDEEVPLPKTNILLLLVTERSYAANARYSHKE